MKISAILHAWVLYNFFLIELFQEPINLRLKFDKRYN